MIRYLLRPIKSIRRLIDLEKRIDNAAKHIQNDRWLFINDDLSRLLTAKYLVLLNERWKTLDYKGLDSALKLLHERRASGETVVDSGRGRHVPPARMPPPPDPQPTRKPGGVS